MAIVFLLTKTDMGPRTIVFVASENDARLLSDTAKFEAMAILPDRPAYASVAQIVAHRAKELDREIRKAKRDLFNVTRLFPKGESHDTGRSLRKR